MNRTLSEKLAFLDVEHTDQYELRIMSKTALACGDTELAQRLRQIHDARNAPDSQYKGVLVACLEG